MTRLASPHPGEGGDDFDQGPRRSAIAVPRTCVISRGVFPQEYLLRFVADPGGRVMEDLGGRLPGRGLYVYPTGENLRTLWQRRGLFDRLAGRAATLSPVGEVLERLTQGLTRRLEEGLGLARRAGRMRFGLDGLAEGLTRGDLQLALLAEDTGEHTREKFFRLLSPHAGVAWFEVLDRERCGGACGRSATAVLTVTDAGLARRVRADAVRWRALVRE